MTEPAPAGITDLRVHAALGVISRTQNLSVLPGTESWLPVMTLGLAPPEALIAAAERPADLAYIRLVHDELRIGSLTTRAQVLTSPVISEYCALLGEAVRADSGRRPGLPVTIGASLCAARPDDGLATVLTAARASVVVRSAHGDRIVPVAGLRGPWQAPIRPGELLAEVRIPITTGGSG
jgi:aerobic carbon-monoxide dehydrogenase medium subunit